MKNLKVQLLIYLLLIGNLGYSQGIKFYDNLDEALKLAKQENKNIFVDFYTSWCGPCKKMTADIFPQKIVGDYFNANFINVKIQCDDKGIGVELGKKYQVNAYPTLMVLNTEGDIVHSMAGAPSAEGLIAFAKQLQIRNGTS